MASLRKLKRRLRVWERQGDRINAVNPLMLHEMPDQYWETLTDIHLERERRGLPTDFFAFMDADRVWDADDYETAEDTAADELPPIETVTAFAEQGLL